MRLGTPGSLSQQVTMVSLILLAIALVPFSHSANVKKLSQVWAKSYPKLELKLSFCSDRLVQILMMTGITPI